MKQLDTLSCLSVEYRARKACNGRYSLRAYARDLGISRSVLSSVLSGKSTLSSSNSKKIQNKLTNTPAKSSFVELPSEKYHLLQRWYYLPLLNLCYLSHQKASRDWIASQLRITLSEAKEGVDTLVREGFLRIERGKLVRTVPSLHTKDEIPSNQIRRYHQSILRLSHHSIEREGIDRREYQTMCLPIAKDKLPEAKKRIRQFHKELASFLEAGNSNELYYLSVQLFPAKGDSGAT